MTILSDSSQFNDAGTQGDWTTSDFDAPVDNNASSSTEIYREGTACQEWVLKENITTGHTFAQTDTAAEDITDGIVVFWWFVTSDADYDKVSLHRLRVSSDTNFTGNYAEWDAKAQVEGLDYYGWFPVAIYPANPDGTGGTVVFTSIDSFGWVATTGGVGTKLTGFDFCHKISEIQGHSQTVTMTNLFDHDQTNDLGVINKFGDFFKSRVNVRLGGGTTTNMIFNESDKTLFFDNVEPEHNLGFIFSDNTSGTNTFDIDGWGISWNQQDGTTPEVFTTPANCDIFRINGCSFARGGLVTLPPHISVADTFVTNCVFNGCDRIDPNDITFTGNTISNTADADGGLVIDASGTGRMSDLIFNSDGTGHAIEVTATGTYTFDNFTYNGYGAAATTDASIFNDSGGLVTLNITGGDTPTIRNGTGASTVVNNNVSLTFAGLKDNTEVRVYTAGTTTELAGVENATDGTADNRSVTFSLGASTSVDVRFMNEQWIVPDRNSILAFSWPTLTTTLPITQVFDRSFDNP